MYFPTSSSPITVTAWICIFSLANMHGVEHHPTSYFDPLVIDRFGLTGWSVVTSKCSCTPVDPLLLHDLSQPRRDLYDDPLNLRCVGCQGKLNVSVAIAG